MTLKERLDQINAEAKAINDRNDGSWSSGLTDNIAYWNEIGVHTAEELDHYLAVEAYHNIYKDVHGIRPRWMDFNTMTTSEIEEAINQI